MSTIDRALNAKLERALHSPDIPLQHSTITTLIQNVTRYVEQIKQDEEVVAQIRSYESRLRSLKGGGEEAAAEKAEVEELLRNAEVVERQLRRKRDTIKLLEREVGVLYRELRKL